MAEKEKLTPNNLDIARMAFGAYQSYGEKPVYISIASYKEGTSVDEIYGMVNPCKFGDQCEGHACYCNHPNGYRKCRNSWYMGIKEEDSKCKYYEPNPYWQKGNGDFYEQRNATIKYMQEQGLVEYEIIKVNKKPHNFHKGRKSALVHLINKENSNENL